MINTTSVLNAIFSAYRNGLRPIALEYSFEYASEVRSVFSVRSEIIINDEYALELKPIAGMGFCRLVCLNGLGQERRFNVFDPDSDMRAAEREVEECLKP